MKDNHELPASAKRAFEEYPHIKPSASFNCAVLESLTSAQSKRQLSVIGKIEEFLGVGLWQFVGSGALGAFLPVLMLGGLLLSGHAPQPPNPSPTLPNPMKCPGFLPFGEVYRRESEIV